ncbi:MAG: class I SAM-dependent methyltransferase [Desulfobulbaceae bacterium]|nr:class I SAM-dependent methyltransferase [Desulfobulbaceae bacterium]
MLMNPEVRQLKKCVGDFIAFEAARYPPGLAYNQVLAMIHELCFHTGRLEGRLGKEGIMEIIAPAREIQGRSRFINRMQTWPRGYPGDFETIEYLLRCENHTPPGSTEFYCEEYTLRSPPPQQHRNKVQEQAREILQVARANARARIMSLGCGSCPDIALVLPFLESDETEFYLIDLDPNALAFSRQRLGSIEARCHFAAANILKAAGQFPDTTFELIIIGGVFDYLPDALIVRVLRDLAAHKLAPGGKLFFTNISTDNSYRYWMNYFVNWEIRERSREDLLALCDRAGLGRERLSIRKDLTGLTFLVEYRQAAPGGPVGKISDAGCAAPV